MNIDLFGPQFSRYARRNTHNTLKGELEASSGVKQAKATSFTDNLAAALQRPVTKATAAKSTAPSDIGKPVGHLVGRVVSVTKCESGVCRTIHVKKRK